MKNVCLRSVPGRANAIRETHAGASNTPWRATFASINPAGLYLPAALLGALIQCGFFVPFIIQNGLALPEFIRQLFSSLPAGGFTADLLISSFVFWLWSRHESRRYGVRHWWFFVVLNLTIGLSCALPLFLYFRHNQMNHTSPSADAIR